MQVWNVLHAARWKYRTQKSPFWHHRTTLSGYIFGTKACIDNRKNFLNRSPHVLIIWWSSAYKRLRYVCVFGAPLQISTGFASWQRYCTAHSSNGRQPNCAALNRVRHIYSAIILGLAHISSFYGNNLSVPVQLLQFIICVQLFCLM